MIKPKLRTTQDWEIAQFLMQPAFIRIVDRMRQALEESSWTGDYEEVEEPEPGFVLVLTQGDITHRVLLWDLCFQVCFVDYPPPDPEQFVTPDVQLIDTDGEVNWDALDAKVKLFVQQFLAQLPTNS